MSTALQLRRGTTSQHETFTGLVGEITVDTTKSTLVVHDGRTAGGFPLAKDSTISGTVRSDVVQGLSDSEKATALDNIGAMKSPASTGAVVRTTTGVSARELKAGKGIKITNGDFQTDNPEIANAGVTSLNGMTGDVTVPVYSKAALLNEDGAGSGLDADLLDGQHASYFASASSLNSLINSAIGATVYASTGTVAVSAGDVRAGSSLTQFVFTNNHGGLVTDAWDLTQHPSSATLSGTWLCIVAYSAQSSYISQIYSGWFKRVA